MGNRYLVVSEVMEPINLECGGWSIQREGDRVVLRLLRYGTDIQSIWRLHKDEAEGLALSLLRNAWKEVRL